MEDHITVFKNEAIEALNIRKESTIVDATLGAGGHSREILRKLGTGGVFVGIDADTTAVESFTAGYDTEVSSVEMHLAVGNFRHIDSIFRTFNIDEADGILADLGWRMEQMSGNGKGFSFRVDEPLLMTFGNPETYAFTAADIVNGWEETDIANVLKGYGEERFARRIADAIVAYRKTEVISSSVQLADIVEAAVPHFYRRGKLHPATRTFQALRIAVNDECEALKEFIDASVQLLAPKGRLVIISFHSLEDRIVKRSFREAKEKGTGTIVTKRPLTPTQTEQKNNPRSRSAKMRILEKK